MTVDGFLTTYGGSLILPLSIIEGPIVSISAGFLAARGYFSWYWALPLLICGDVIGDMLYYWIGRTGLGPLARLGRLVRMHRGLTPAFRENLARNSTRMLLIGKWTHSIGGLVLLGSGALRLPLARYCLICLLATIPKSTALFGFGYFAGGNYRFVEQHAVLEGVGLAVLGLASIGWVLWRGGVVRAGR